MDHYGVNECIKYKKWAKYNIMALSFTKYAIKLKKCRNMHTVIPKIPRFSLLCYMCSVVQYNKLECSVKRCPHYRPWRPMGDVDARVHIFVATALGWGTVASPTLGRLYPSTHFIWGWEDPRTSLDMKEYKKISTPPTPEIKPDLSSPLPSALPLEPPGPWSVLCTVQ